MATKRAVVAAINDYGGAPNDLPSCIKDAQEFMRALKDLYGFRQQDIHYLEDGQATIGKVEADLDWLCSGATPDSRLVFYYSGHGYQMPVSDRLEEFLVLSGMGLWQDDQLVNKAKALPPGVLTVVLDSCFSGGMHKLVLLPDGRMEIGQAKVWQPPAHMVKERVGQKITAGKRFLRRPTTRIEKFLSLADGGMAKGDDEAADVEGNFLLVSACSENETASASTSATNGLSAFTWAFLEQCRKQGAQASASALFGAAAEALKPRFNQTPRLLSPTSAPGMKDKGFILLGAEAGRPAAEPDGSRAGTAEPAEEPAGMWAWFEELFGPKGVQKELATMSSYNGEGSMTAAMAADGQQKIFGSVLRVFSAVAPIAMQALMGQRKGAAPAEQEEMQKSLSSLLEAVRTLAPIAIQAIRDLGQRKSLDPGEEEAQRKFLNTLLQIATTVLPIVEQALGQRKGAATPEEERQQEKFLGTLLQIVSTVAPIAIEAMGTLAQRKAFSPAEEDEQQKFLGSLVRVVSQFAPIAIRAVHAFAQRKGASDRQLEQQKFLAALLPVVSTLAPIAIQAIQTLTRRKEVVLADGQQKFLSDLLNLVTAVAPIAAQAIQTFGQRKGLSPVQEEQQEKFLGALLPVISTLAPIAIQAVQALSRRKTFAAPEEEEQQKFLSALLPVITTLAPIAMQAIEAFGTRKDFMPEEERQKFLGALLPVISTLAPIAMQAIQTFAQRKAMMSAEEEEQQKFLSAVLPLIPHIAPIVLQAVQGLTRRKELMPADEEQQKFLSALLPVVTTLAPIAIQAIQSFGQRKDFMPAEEQQKFLGALLPAVATLAPFALRALFGQRKGELELPSDEQIAEAQKFFPMALGQPWRGWGAIPMPTVAPAAPKWTEPAKKEELASVA